MRKSVKVLFVLLFISSLTSSVANAEELQYNHAFTFESPNPEDHIWFGYQVKISGDIIAVSEPFADVDDFLGAGKVYIYNTNGELVSTLQSPTPGMNDNFGYRFDLHADILVIWENAYIGEIKYAGKAHVFTTDGIHQLTIQSPEPKQGGYFGRAGIYDDMIVIWENRDEGVVYMFNKEGKYLQTLLSPTPIASGTFGESLEVDESLILVGETGYDTAARGPGSVHVFNHDGDHLMTLQAPEPEELAMFGVDMAISEDKIVIGEGHATVDGLFQAGRAYIYNTNGEFLHSLQSPNPKLGGRFGKSVAIDGDRLVVGEALAHVNSNQYEGRAYVYDVDGSLLQNLTAVPPLLRAAFGLDLAIDGDYIVVGEPWAPSGELGQVGRVHVFKLGPPVEAQEPVEETITETEETETETNRGIPGYPVWSIGLAILLVSIILSRTQKH